MARAQSRLGGILSCNGVRSHGPGNSDHLNELHWGLLVTDQMRQRSLKIIKKLAESHV